MRIWVAWDWAIGCIPGNASGLKVSVIDDPMTVLVEIGNEILNLLIVLVFELFDRPVDISLPGQCLCS
jgi:hypothetical protein